MAPSQRECLRRKFSSVSEPVVTVSELTRRFGATTALDSVSLSLPRGAVYGLVGATGAGKTTLIKHLLGLLRAESGSVRVFGLDPVADRSGSCRGSAICPRKTTSPAGCGLTSS